ncbi:zinc ribbon domain-containing protein [Mycolicibacterium baixiangningiae]|uniref:zinc ribbon domain-containing protein n=1 Tax=Mycolicibacterium baixiangningiae TaxID=2761578 RepID=UPI0018D03F9A|nr:C4-type zinc ribbon domain-containing protein [Mycolicibacterium baixiangningiae]
MKADVWQQHSLLQLAEVDAGLARIEHRVKKLPEQEELDRVRAELVAAQDRSAALGIAMEDLDEQVAKFESEIDAVRQREDRDRALLNGDSVAAKQVGELQHELETLERRQASLEDSLLEVMERREELAGRRVVEVAAVDELDTALRAAQHALAEAVADLDRSRQESLTRREELLKSLQPDLVDLYERQRARGGQGAGQLQGRRCGACRIEIDRGEMSRISAAADDEVLRCPECNAILVRAEGFKK